MDKLTIFRYVGVIETLLYLFQYPNGRRKVDIRKDLNLTTASALNSHKKLLVNGLIHGIQYVDATAFTLTKRGREIANLLSKILKLIDEDEVNGFIFELNSEKSYFKNKIGE